MSLTQMRMFLDEYADIPFRVLRFLVTEINYGGRVTDDKDRRLINNLVTGFVGQQVLDPGYDFSASGAALHLSPIMQGQLCLSVNSNVHACMHACLSVVYVCGVTGVRYTHFCLRVVVLVLEHYLHNVSQRASAGFTPLQVTSPTLQSQAVILFEACPGDCCQVLPSASCRLCC